MIEERDADLGLHALEKRGELVLRQLLARVQRDGRDAERRRLAVVARIGADPSPVPGDVDEERIVRLDRALEVRKQELDRASTRRVGRREIGRLALGIEDVDPGSVVTLLEENLIRERQVATVAKLGVRADEDGEMIRVAVAGEVVTRDALPQTFGFGGSVARLRGGKDAREGRAADRKHRENETD